MGKPPHIQTVSIGKLDPKDPWVDLGVMLGEDLVNAIANGKIPAEHFTTVFSVLLACVTSALIRLSPGIITQDEVLEVLGQNAKTIMPALKTLIVTKSTGEPAEGHREN